MDSKTIKKYSTKTIPALRRTAKKYFNLYIRLLDCDKNGFATCISSGQPLRFGSENMQAGHYFSAGKYPELEFNEDNVHVQGKSDNYFNGANLLEYRKNLIKKIGIERVERLEQIAEQSKRVQFHHDRFFLIETIEKYKEKSKALRSQKNF